MHRAPAITCAVCLPLLAACNLLTPIVLVIEPTKKVLPEFDKLAGKRVAVLVWAQPATLFDYPHTRFELAAYVGDKIYAEMRQRELGTQVVDPREVEDFLQKNLDAQIDPYAVGRRFNADYVVYVELLEFQVRDPQAPQFLRGRIHAGVSVHDVQAAGAAPRRYELLPVQCIHPEENPVPLTATNAPLIREATYRKFAELVARKFYEHTVES
jgi:hypothetical protein